MDEFAWRNYLERIIETIAESILIIDKNGVIVYANASAETLLGVKRSSLIGAPYNEPGYGVTTLDGKPFPIEQRPYTRALRTGTILRDIEYVVMRADGSHVSVSVNATPLDNGKGDIIGVTLSFTDITQRTEAYAELSASEKMLWDITSVLGEGVYMLDEDGKLIFMNPEAERLLGWSESELFAKDMHATIHFQKADGTPLPAGECPVLKVTRAGDTYRTEEDVFTRKDGRMLPVAYVCTPIMEDGKIIASVTAFQDITERKRAKELGDALNRISALITSTLDFNAIMQSVVVESTKAIGCESATIILREGDYWVTRYVYGFTSEVIGRKLTGKQVPIIVLAASKKEAIVSNDILSDKRINHGTIELYNVRSLLTVPLLMKDEVIGAITFNYHSAPLVFSEAQIDFAGKLARSVSLALENARLYSTQRHIADILQESLLTMPERVEGITFGYLYRSASEAARIGGDFYDLFEIEHGKIGIIIGDVSGKGIEAAALTAIVRNTIKAHAFEGGTPALIMAKTNDMLVKTSPPNIFMTAFFGVLELDTGKLTYCCAGHPPAMIKRGSFVQLLTKNSPMIGGFPRMHYRSGKANLKKGDILLLYTDGIIEARDNGEFFGEQRLVNLLKDSKPMPAKEVPGVLFDRVMEFTDGELSDDVAILVVSHEK